MLAPGLANWAAKVRAICKSNELCVDMTTSAIARYGGSVVVEDFEKRLRLRDSEKLLDFPGHIQQLRAALALGGSGATLDKGFQSGRKCPVRVHRSIRI